MSDLQSAPPIMRYFDFSHLPQQLQEVSGPFHTVAHMMLRETTPGAEQSAGLRKLLEAKDCFVRAAVQHSPTNRG